MRTHRRCQEGWTLIEAVLATTMLLVVFGGALALLNLQSDFWELATTQTDSRSEVERIMASVVKELRLARRVTAGIAPNISIPAAPGNTTMTFYVPTDVDGDHTVLDAIGAVEWNTADPIQLTYDAASQQLRRLQGGVTRVLATHVTAATFSDQAIDGTLASNEVRVALTTQQMTAHQRPVAMSASTVVRLRN